MEVFFAVVFFGAGVSGGDWIDEDEVGLVEEGVFVVDEFVGWWSGVSEVVDWVDALWAEGSEVEPDGAGAWSAVEGEGDWAGGWVGEGWLGVLL